MMSRYLGALGMAALLAVIAAPAAAQADSGDWDGSTLWYPYSNDGTDPASDGNYLKISPSSTNGLYTETWINSGAVKPAWDSSWVVTNGFDGDELNCAAVSATRSDPGDALGGVVLSCAPEVLTTADGEITVTREFRVFADGQTVRMLLTVENTGTTEVTAASLRIADNFYCDGWTNVEWSTTGGSNIALWAAGGTDGTGHVVTAEDLAYVLDAPGDVFSGGIGCPAVLVVRASADAPVLPAQGGSSVGGDAAGHSANDTNITEFTLHDLAPGEASTIAVLARYYHFAYGSSEAETKANALIQSDAAIAAGTTEDFTRFATAGLADPSSVVNWATASTGVAALAATGAPDESPVVMLAVLIAACGGAAVLAARRRSSGRA